MREGIFGAAVLCAALPLRPCAAQSDPRLVAAVRLAQDGQGDSARAMVKRVLDATPVADPLYAEALYASGVVAASTTEMERQFQRLVVEHNGSAWADDALLRLAQLNFARGDLAAVTRNAERLASDYPGSEVLPQTAVWAARAYFRQQDTGDGCRWLANGLARADTLDVELRNDLTFLNGRCVAAGDTAQGRSGAAAQGDTTRAAPTPQGASVWSVQVASSSTQANADALVARLARDGFPGGYVVPDGAAFKVRVGKFPTRDAVDQLLGRMRAKYPGAFVVESRP
ncbi:MAG TPA: SPOR domain-containing protein [Gemmatimonadales bacterium]|nr:SPOR domain-containing protein [Gemmatimonadales bacterium]